MDYTVEYVMMCEKAYELQDMKEHREMTQKDFIAKKTEGDNTIWLPRQDQIQEIILELRLMTTDGEEDSRIEPSYDDYGRLMEDVVETYSKNRFAISLEQAHLCLFMKEVYYKTWNIISKEWEIV
jgi:hypothetical protein